MRPLHLLLDFRFFESALLNKEGVSPPNKYFRFFSTTCYVAKVVYLALRCARPACLYHYRALANEKKLTSLYTSQACVSARVVLTLASCMYYNTHICLLF